MSTDVRPENFQRYIDRHKIFPQKEQVDEQYVLDCGDVLNIEVAGTEKSFKELRTISLEKTFFYPEIGLVLIQEMTAGQLNASITSSFASSSSCSSPSPIIAEPHVTIEVVQPRKNIYIGGSVRQPGYYAPCGKHRAIEWLLLAGGLSEFDVEMWHTRIPDTLADTETPVISAEVSSLIQNLHTYLVKKEQKNNLWVQGGDILFVSPEAPFHIQGTERTDQPFYIVGSVRNPGTYQYKADYTVLHALLLSGGMEMRDITNHVTIMREKEGRTQHIRVKLRDMLEQNDFEQNTPLLPGDLIVVGPAGY
jgi:protein involved in polysaccharide export with SLBB domain